MQVDLHKCVYMYIHVYNSQVFCLIKWWICYQIQTRHIINLRNLYQNLLVKWGELEKVCRRVASSPLGVLRTVKFNGSPGLLWWRCCHGGGFQLQYVRKVLNLYGPYFMMHSFLTLVFYCLWWRIYYRWCKYFYQKDFRFMYDCIFTYDCVFYYVLGQRWLNKQLKSINQ